MLKNDQFDKLYYNAITDLFQIYTPYGILESKDYVKIQDYHNNFKQLTEEQLSKVGSVILYGDTKTKVNEFIKIQTLEHIFTKEGKIVPKISSGLIFNNDANEALVDGTVLEDIYVISDQDEIVMYEHPVISVKDTSEIRSLELTNKDPDIHSVKIRQIVSGKSNRDNYYSTTITVEEAISSGKTWYRIGQSGWRGIAEIIDCSLDVPNESINHIIARPISYIPPSPVIRTAAFISFF